MSVFWMFKNGLIISEDENDLFNTLRILTFTPRKITFTPRKITFFIVLTHENVYI